MLQKPPGYEGPNHRTHVVQSPLQSKRSPHDRSRRYIRDQRIPRRRAEPFAEPVHDAQPDHLPRCRRERDDRPHGGREEIAAHDQRPAARRPVGEPAGDELYECRSRVGGAVQRAQRRRPATQDAGDERRQQRVHHLTREIVEKGDGTEKLDLPGEGRGGTITHPNRVPSGSE